MWTDKIRSPSWFVLKDLSKYVRLLVLIGLSIFLLGTPANWANGANKIELTDAIFEGDLPLPLPTDCTSLAPPGGSPPESCVFGYVFFDGQPVAGAQITVRSPAGSLMTSTQSGPASPDPYYAVDLSGAPLQVTLDELVTVQASYAGEVNTTLFTVVQGSQQVDVWLSTACGPTTITGGNINNNTTWIPACSPYVLTGNLNVSSVATLTIQPGVTVKFYPDIALSVEGNLVARGLPNAMVHFTTSSAASPGAWAYLLFSNTTGGFSDMEYALVEYAGGTSLANTAAILVSSGNVSIEHVTLHHSAAHGIRVYDTGMLELWYSNIYENAKWGVYLDSVNPLIHVSYNDINHNGQGGVYVSYVNEIWIYGNTIAHNLKSGIEIRTGTGTANIGSNTIMHNQATYGGGIYITSGVAYVNYNKILQNTATQNGGGIYTSRSHIINNNLILGNVSNNLGGGLYQSGGSAQFNYNIVAGNQARDGGGVYFNSVTSGSVMALNSLYYNQTSAQGGALYVKDSDLAVFYNTIMRNSTGAGLGGVYIQNYPSFHDNNLRLNMDYDLFNGNLQGTPDLQVPDNWWGTPFSQIIPLFIWDWYDDASLSKADFSLPLASEVLLAPISLPSGLSGLVADDNINLSWSANRESDAAGYKIYYDRDEAGYPYNGQGADQGNSPVVVGNVLSYTLTSLPPGIYHLAVTAYDNDYDGLNDWTDGNESWFSSEQVLQVGETPVASFSASPTSGAPPLAVIFTDFSSGDFDTWHWHFGDGDISHSQNPTHTYTIGGIYTVTLTVDGPLGSSSDVQPYLIDVYRIPVAVFSAAPVSGFAPLQVNFSDLSTGSVQSWNWDFGDGGTSSGRNPSHLYTISGVYSVTLTVDGPLGTHTDVKPEFIHVYQTPRAEFIATPLNGIAPLGVNFTDMSTGTIQNWSWNFGDGGSSTLMNPSHTYNQPGTYSVKLTVSAYGVQDEKTRLAYIQVMPTNPPQGYKIYLPGLFKR